MLFIQYCPSAFLLLRPVTQHRHSLSPVVTLSTSDDKKIGQLSFSFSVNTEIRAAPILQKAARLCPRLWFRPEQIDRAQTVDHTDFIHSQLQLPLSLFRDVKPQLLLYPSTGLRAHRLPLLSLCVRRCSSSARKSVWLSPSPDTYGDSSKIKQTARAQTRVRVQRAAVYYLPICQRHDHFCRADISIIAPVTATANPSALEVHGRIHLMTRGAKRLRFSVSVLFDVLLRVLCSAQQHQSGC